MHVQEVPHVEEFVPRRLCRGDDTEPEEAPGSAEEHVRERGEHQVGGAPQRHRLRSHRRLQQTLRTAARGGLSPGPQVHIAHHTGGVATWRVRRSHQILQDRRLSLSVRVRRGSHRGSPESLQQGPHRAAAVRSRDRGSHDPARHRQARHTRVPLRVLVRARTESLAVPAQLRPPAQQGTLPGAVLSGDLLAARRLRALLQGAEGVLLAAGLQTDEASRSRGGPSAIPQQEQELAR